MNYQVRQSTLLLMNFHAMTHLSMLTVKMMTELKLLLTSNNNLIGKPMVRLELKQDDFLF